MGINSFNCPSCGSNNTSSLLMCVWDSALQRWVDEDTSYKAPAFCSDCEWAGLWNELEQIEEKAT